MSDSSLIVVEHVYDNNLIVGLGTTKSTKYACKNASNGAVLAYIAVSSDETVIYYPRILTLDDATNVINTWNKFSKK